MARIAMVGDDTGETCLFDGALSEEESSDNVTAGGRFVALFGVVIVVFCVASLVLAFFSHFSRVGSRCLPFCPFVSALSGNLAKAPGPP